ncbi:MAG: hypothetical protein AAGH49_07495 [Pseudomonadota bacterium]
MSRAKTAKFALPLVAILSTVACASADKATELTPEEQAYQDAIAQALEPATAEEIAQAERSDPITRANFWSTEYQKDSGNLEVTVKFMSALRGIGSHERIQELASKTLPIHPTSYQIYLELGRSYMQQNKAELAAQAFVRSADFAPASDATPLAALGVAFDRLENHAQAQDAYRIALEREPDRVSTLSNYGLSLALTGQLQEAEASLRKAANLPGADVRVRQNLALILGLQGRFDEMVKVDPSAPARSVEANQRALRQMMVPTGNFNDLKALDDVIDEVRRTPAKGQAMPSVDEAEVSAESMGDLNPAAAPEPKLAGEATQHEVLPLRPKLRGAQGG